MIFFLKMKAWQFFIFIVLTWFVGPTILFKLGLREPYNSMPVLLLFIVFIGWLWSIGVNLNKLIPDDLRMNISSFRYALLYTLIYMLFFILFFVYIWRLGTPHIPSYMLVIVPLHLLAMVCMFYAFGFVAKTLTMAEKQINVKVNDYVGNFFLIWFFPIGIWFIQPRVNKLFKSN
jgi:hypothetical protein